MAASSPPPTSTSLTVASLDVNVTVIDVASGSPLEQSRCTDAVLQEVEKALRAAAPVGTDEDSRRVEVLPGQNGHLILRLHLDGSVGAARELRDYVLAGDLELAAARSLGEESPIGLRVDRSSLAEQYEESVLALETLTAHQQEKLQACSADSRTQVHLQAPAGAGKTFVALHRILDALQDPDNPNALVLFVARNEALANFAASWIGKRVRNISQRSQALARLHLLHEPFQDGVRSVVVKGNRVLLQPYRNDEPVKYALVVVDEAHHVYSDEVARAFVEAQVSATKTQRMLLSDISQSLGRDIAYPAGLTDVTLSEVVRCSKRIVAGAMAFQLGGNEKLLTKCHHESTGPPLKSFLFDRPHRQDGASDGLPALQPSPSSSFEGFFEAYAEHTVRALDHVISAFPGLSLHNRVALVVPDSNFSNCLCRALRTALSQHFSNRSFCLVDAITASSDLGHRCDGEQEQKGNDEEEGEWLVCDTIAQLDGLERLIVIGIGLDSIIKNEDTKVTVVEAPLETRSMLYRAVTRAHLMFLVVNEFLRGGWLEFLGSVRLRDDEAFSSAMELKRTQVQAVEEFVKTELTKSISAAAGQRGINLNGQALSQLASNAARLEEEKGFEREKAVTTVLQSWTSTVEFVISALEKATKQSGFSFSNRGKLEEVTVELAIAVQRSEVLNLGAAALEALKKDVGKVHNAQIKEALEVAVAQRGRNLDSKLLAVLLQRIAVVAERGECVEAAAQTAVDEWQQTEVQITESLQERLSNPENLSNASIAGGLSVSTLATADALSRLHTQVVAGICEGLTLEQAVERSWQQWQKDELDKKMDSALRDAMADAARHTPVCAEGASVCLSGLKKTSLNNQVGTVQNFVMSSLRWSVRLVSGRTIAVKADNMQPQGEHGQPECSPEQASSTKDDHRQPQQSIEAAMPMLKTALLFILEENFESGARNVAFAAARVVARWRRLEAEVLSALQVTSASRQFHIPPEALTILSQRIIRSLWQDKPHQVASDMEPPSGEDNSREVSFEECVTEVLDDWVRHEHSQQEDVAQIASALEAKANSERLVITDTAAATLQQRVASALRRGESLDAAVTMALREWKRQMVRTQVQQTVWDPSGNLTRKATGVVRFMPFKSNVNHFDYWVLTTAFEFLHFHDIGVIARVSKRWRNAAADPSWKPDCVAYAWGHAAVSGLAVDCPKPTLLEFSLAKQVRQITVADNATFALSDAGTVWFWGCSWLPDVEDICEVPTQLEELSDVVSVTATPPGYFHGRNRRLGYSCAAVTRRGDLFTWGLNSSGQLFHDEGEVERPTRVVAMTEVWNPSTERVLHASCGLDFIALCVERPVPAAPSVESPMEPNTSVITCGRFCPNGMFRRPPNRYPQSGTVEWPELRGIPLRQLKAGSFHCCALSTRGELYTFGHRGGQDTANGNLLGTGNPVNSVQEELPPQRVVTPGLGPIAEVGTSTYSNIAVTVDGRVFSWGDCDGNALGHDVERCHSPTWLRSLRWQRVSHGSLSYTNGAVATDEGRVFVWGGNAWEGGIAAGRNTSEPSEVKWSGVPPCYRCTSVALAHKHGYLIFQKLP